MENKINVGDYIVCLEKPNSNPFIKKTSEDLKQGGSGYVSNLCIKVNKITQWDDYPECLWFEKHMNGVYSNSVRLASYEEINYYNEINGPYDITKVNLKPVKSNITILINILKFINNHEIIFAKQSI